MTLLTIIFFSLILMELLYFQIAKKYNIIDKPNERSSHSTVTLRGGGIIFPIAGLLYFFLYGFSCPLFILGLVLISIVSFWDDIRPLPNKIRITVHFTALLLLFVQWGLFQHYLLLVLPVLVLCAGIINAWNFMDGINGITGGYSLVVLTGLAVADHFYTPFVEANLIAVFIVSLLIFNFFNFRTKAKCFAGDVGSVSIAFVVVFLLGAFMLAASDLSPICFVAVYGTDSVLTIIHRLFLKENIFKPHRKHLYQILANERKIPHIVVSLLYMGVQAGIIAGYFAVLHYGTPFVWTYIACVLAALIVVYVTVKSKWYHLHANALRT